MITLMATHEVDDVEHWRSSTKRGEFFGGRGMTVRTFVDPSGSNLVGVLIDTPDMATFEAAMATPEAAEAMKHDGVRPETLRVFAES